VTPREPSPFGPGNPSDPSARYVFLRFLRYGFLAWGGPVAQIGLMHRELVERDGWITEDRFRKTLALYQALPGPEAHELAVYFGMVKRGRLGGFLAGLGFMLPGVVLVTLLAAAYLSIAGVSDHVHRLLYGVRPAVAALVGFAVYRLARRTVDSALLAAIAVGAILASLLAPAVGLVGIMAAGGLAALAATAVRSARSFAFAPLGLASLAFPALGASGLLALAVLSAKVGLLTFGGAYTAIPFLQAGAVEEHGWITQAQFLDALAITSLVPGPLVAVGTFVGYLAAGPAGALLATVLIFAPAFAFTLVGHAFFERIVHAPRLHAFLMGVTAAVIGLIAVSIVPIARAGLVDIPTVAIALGAALALARHVPIPAVVAGAAAAGLLVRLAAG